MQRRLELEQAAKASGDPTRVEAASKSIVALALVQLAELRSAETAWPQAALLYRQALEIEDSPDTRRKLDAAVLRAKSTRADLQSDSSAEVSPLTLAHAHLSAQKLKELRFQEHQLRQILGDGYNDWGSAEARDQNFSQALTLFQQGERWDISNVQIKRNAGMAAFRSGDYAESARALNAVLESDPSDARSRVLMAMSYFSMEKYREAAAAFAPLGNAALDDPRTAYAWAYSLAHSDQQQQANRVVDALIEKPLPADVLVSVCGVYRDTENYEHAVTCFKKAYGEDPSIQKAHYGAGEALIRLDRPADAVPELRDELKNSPDDPQVQYLLAFALLQTSHKDEAATLLRSVVAAQPQHAQAQYELGKLLLEQGQTADAITHLEMAEKADPSPDYIHYQLQSAYRRAGRTGDADRELKVYRAIKEKKREISPQHALQTQ